MKNTQSEDLSQSLTSLSKFLLANQNNNEHGMNITMTHGFLYSMISSPCSILPTDWMFVIFGGLPKFQSIEQQQEIYTATLALHDAVNNQLLLGSKTNLFLWVDDGQIIDIYLADDKVIANFCSGYVKGYILDPILKEALMKLGEPSLSFFLALIKLAITPSDSNDRLNSGADEKNPETLVRNVDSDMRKTLQCIMAENYKN